MLYMHKETETPLGIFFFFLQNFYSWNIVNSWIWTTFCSNVLKQLKLNSFKIIKYRKFKNPSFWSLEIPDDVAHESNMLTYWLITPR